MELPNPCPLIAAEVAAVSPRSPPPGRGHRGRGKRSWGDLVKGGRNEEAGEGARPFSVCRAL